LSISYCEITRRWHRCLQLFNELEDNLRPAAIALNYKRDYCKEILWIIQILVRENPKNNKSILNWKNLVHYLLFLTILYATWSWSVGMLLFLLHLDWPNLTDYWSHIKDVFDMNDDEFSYIQMIMKFIKQKSKRHWIIGYLDW
jgi:hypothetical protein